MNHKSTIFIAHLSMAPTHGQGQMQPKPLAAGIAAAAPIAKATSLCSVLS